MTTKTELMGLGVPAAVANRLGHTPISVTVAGTTMSGARLCRRGQYDLYVIATNSGGGLVLQSPASAGGFSPGDRVMVANYLGASVTLYIRNALAILNGVSVSGSGGISVGAGQVCMAEPITASTWAVLGSVLSAS